MDIPNLRWWGWGTLDQDFSLEGRPAFWPTLREWLELPDEAIEHEVLPVSLEEVSLRPPRLDDPMLSSLRRLLGGPVTRPAPATEPRVRDFPSCGGWVKHTAGLSAYAGQSVSLQIRADIDGSVSSSFFIDDVAFE